MCSQPYQAEANNASQAWSARLLEIYVTDRERLVATAMRVLRDRSKAEDAVQDAVVKFHARSCCPTPGKELAYLRTMVLNNALGDLRRSARLTEAATEGVSPDDPEATLLSMVSQDHVLRAIAALPERQRDVSYLRYVRGCSTDETAAQLAISAGAVKTHAFRARAGLREQLGVDASWERVSA